MKGMCSRTRSPKRKTFFPRMLVVRKPARRMKMRVRTSPMPGMCFRYWEGVPSFLRTSKRIGMITRSTLFTMKATVKKVKKRGTRTANPARKAVLMRFLSFFMACYFFLATTDRGSPQILQKPSPALCSKASAASYVASS